MDIGDVVQIIEPRSSFKGCIGSIVSAHDKFDDTWWVRIEGWSDMTFLERYLLKL